MTFMFKTSRYMWEPMGNRAICFSSLLKKSRRERASHQKGLLNLFLQERMIKFGWKKYRSCHLLITIKKTFLSKVQSKDEHVKRFLLVCSVFIIQQLLCYKDDMSFESYRSLGGVIFRKTDKAVASLKVVKKGTLSNKKK